MLFSLSFCYYLYSVLYSSLPFFDLASTITERPHFTIDFDIFLPSNRFLNIH
jgi:hypothetical protein